MAQQINLFGEDILVTDAKVDVTVVGDHVVTTVSMNAAYEGELDTIYATTVHAPYGVKDTLAVATDSIAIAGVRYKEWLESVGAIVAVVDLAENQVDTGAKG
jgi:hypothetical protein